MGRNIRYALRKIRQAPVFTAVAVFSLAIGIGANTAIYSLVEGLLLRDPPVQDADRLVNVYESDPSFPYSVLSLPNLEDLKNGTDDIFEGVAASIFSVARVDDDQGGRPAPVQLVTGDYFPLLGLGARLGRTILSEDDVERGGHPVAMVSYGMWADELGADPDVIGESINLNGRDYTIVGVTSQDYKGLFPGIRTDLFVPMSMVNEIQMNREDLYEQRGSHSAFVTARLLPGVTPAAADARLESISVDLREAYPGQWESTRSFFTVPFTDVVVYPPADRVIVPASGMLMGVVGLLLLIACANLASFLIARAIDRRREVAVRIALGASRKTLVGQLLTESVLLGLFAGATGLLFGVLALEAVLRAPLPIPLPIDINSAPNLSVLVFCLGISLVAGLLLGLIPALQGTRPDVAGTLKNEATSVRRSGTSIRDLLVVGQVAVSLVLLTVAGLFVRSLGAAAAVSPGFGEEPAAMVSYVLPGRDYDAEETVGFVNELSGRVLAMPGVEAVGTVDNPPLNQLSSQSINVLIDGVDPPVDRTSYSVEYIRADSGFFEAAGISLVRGRVFDSGDRLDSPDVAVVSAAFVDRFFGGRNPIGEFIRRPDPDAADLQIVGVVENVKVRNLAEQPRPLIYRSYVQSPIQYLNLLAKSSVAPEALFEGIARELRRLEPAAVVWQTRTLRDHIDVVLVPAKLGAVTLLIFAAIALSLALVGLYGVVAHSVAQRTREVGIRLSLGADAGGVVKMLMAGGLKLVIIGGVVGVALAALLSSGLSRLLFGVQPLDPLTFAIVPLLFVTTAAFASYLPARRASRIDPVRALRTE